MMLSLCNQMYVASHQPIRLRSLWYFNHFSSRFLPCGQNLEEKRENYHVRDLFHQNGLIVSSASAALSETRSGTV
jgi:hypothetical protein